MDEDQYVMNAESKHLINAVGSGDRQKAIDILHDIEHNSAKQKIFLECNPYNELVDSVLEDRCSGATGAQLVYALSLHAADINMVDKDGDIAFMRYLQEAVDVDLDVVKAFLRCGADICLRNQEGLDVLQYVLQTRELERDVKACVLQYMPGIWRAVNSDDVGTVRRLVNQWCHINIIKEGMSVVQLAYEKGTENIIRVITGIGPSMDFAHGVLAGDYRLVDHVLKSKLTLNVNLKNMADGGVTPVFYAMCQGDQPMVDHLLKHGARLDTAVQGDSELDMPLYFAALSYKPPIDVDILQRTIPRQPYNIDQLYYKGRNVVFHCMDCEVDIRLFDHILHACSSVVLTQRVQGNLDARTYALSLGLAEYVSLIDKMVLEWGCDDAAPDNRNILCLHGYPFMLPLTTGKAGNTDSFLTFLQMVKEYENYKAEMCEAVEVGDPETVREMLYTSSWSERGLNVCHADFRCEGDGQPLLHKAVLRQHHEVVEELAKYYVNTWRRKLDTVRDQHFRTALHYVYGMEREQQLIGILEDYGMSEYVMDKDGRSPLGFKDRRGLPEMKELLQYHLIQDFSNPEPDPWSVTLPLPITGFLKKCLHDNHLHRGHHHSNRGHSLDNKDQNISNSGYIDNNGYQVSRGVKFGDVSNFQSNKHGKSDGVSSLNYENGRNKADYLIQRYSQHLQCQPDGSEFTSLDALPLHNTPSISTRGMSRTGNKYARAEVHGRRKAEKLKLEKRHSGDFGVSKTRNVSDSTTDSEPCVSDHIHDANGISRSLSAEDAFNYHRYTEELGHATKELPKQDSTKSEVDTGGYDSDISSGFSEAGDESDDNQSEYETDREHEDTSQIQNCAIL
ncbi:uncharacterized protein LOC128244585 [Mya arenaria]|uniref:uncharacterized protein LOC128244585 n=1 Tax=Mya arenaria TaxID=6604 RepID=UPI0022E171F4|nr:uncharacterized protein LOC128244585 [Mya arenaria]XP_052818539.1 uncharacterized protein LOC128244585 [Mya arenaria]